MTVESEVLLLLINFLRGKNPEDIRQVLKKLVVKSYKNDHLSFYRNQSLGAIIGTRGNPEDGAS